MYKTDIWFIGGLGAGCLTGGCAIGIVPVFALTSNTQPLFYPKNIDRFCYRMAYDKELTKKRARSALWGGVAGGIAFYAAYIAFIFFSFGLL